jgi:hypothetical protein
VFSIFLLSHLPPPPQSFYVMSAESYSHNQQKVNIVYSIRSVVSRDWPFNLYIFGVQVLQDHYGSSIHTALIIKPDNFWQKQRTNLGSQKYKFEVKAVLGLLIKRTRDFYLSFSQSSPPPHLTGPDLYC